MAPASSMSRRRFLGQTAMAGAAAVTRGLAQATRPRWRAAIIGHTGRGDYGHDLDLVFNDHPQIEVVAVADPVSAGRAKAAARCRTAGQYADYREMLEKERPQLVAVAPRHSDQHHAIASAALAAGAHVLLEKPCTQ